MEEIKLYSLLLCFRNIFMLPQDLIQNDEEWKKKGWTSKWATETDGDGGKSDGSMKNVGHNFAIFLYLQGCALNINIKIRSPRAKRRAVVECKGKLRTFYVFMSGPS